MFLSLHRSKFALAAAAVGLSAAFARADGPQEVPRTRLDMKRILEGSKRSTPRLPLPPPTEAERRPAAKGEWGVVNNARMRKLYLPPEYLGIGFTREPDAGMTLTYPFKTSLFWIVSRINNCYYCMGHQEHKLTEAGLTDSQIASLDGDWSGHPAAERAAFAFTARLSREPHAVGAADLDALRAHYDDAQILEILLAVGGFNAMNRWTGALAIPQEEHREYLTPTEETFRALASLVAPLDRAKAPAETASKASPTAAPAGRPALESRAEVVAALAAGRSRQPRLALLSEPEARAALSGLDLPAGPLPQWVRLLARFPKAGGARVALHRATESPSVGELPPKLRAQIAWIAARHDRAWYALGHAEARLKALGESPEAIEALAGDRAGFTPGERAAFALAAKLTVDPALITDADVAALRAHYTDRAVAEVVFQVAEAAFFNRLTEAAGLALEP